MEKTAIRKIRQILIVAVAIIITISCGKTYEKEPNEIVINSRYSFTGEDGSVLDTELNRLLYEGLAREDEKGEIVPGLAERWEVTPDGRTWTFYLREGIKYSDGTPITTKDFLFSWSNGEYEGSTFKDRYVEMNAINDKVLKIDLLEQDERNPKIAENFLRSIGMSRATPRKNDYPLHGYNYSKIEPSKVVASGAYILKEWSKEKITLERNPHYWNASNVKTGKITLKVVENLSKSLSQFEKGEADFTQIMPKDAARYKGKSEFHEVRSERGIDALFNNRIEEWKNPQIRKAILMAIKRKEGLPVNYISDIVNSGELAREVPYSIPGYNPEEAKRILEKEVVNVASLPVLEILSYSPNNKEIALKIKENLEKNLGLKVKIIFNNDKKHEKSYGLKIENVTRKPRILEKLSLLNREEREKVLSLLKEYETENIGKEEKIRILTEIDSIFALKIPVIVIDDAVYEYFLINPKAKGVKVGKPYGNYILRDPYIDLK